jgi:hypothetical protein
MSVSQPLERAERAMERRAELSHTKEERVKKESC